MKLLLVVVLIRTFIKAYEKNRPAKDPAENSSGAGNVIHPAEFRLR